KKHKASYKAITAVSSISEPLQLLHMDLFGTTSIRSINHKYYCLVITDDYSRLGLWYPRESPFVLEAYSDSDYAGANKDRKSTTWQCKKQTIMATSSTKAEYVAAAN
ncbi:putative ribonuclease H-like domain-containing protein, partial [Tanacetum coccineum]